MAAVPVSLDLAIESLLAYPEDARQRVLNLLQKILMNVISNPGDARFTRLNIEKVTPKLTVCGLGPVFVLQHAGFSQGQTHFELRANSEDKLQTVLATLQSMGSGPGAAPAAPRGGSPAGLSEQERSEAEQARVDAEWEEVARKNRELRLAQKAQQEAEERERKAEQEARQKALDEAAAALEARIEEQEDVVMGDTEEESQRAEESPVAGEASAAEGDLDLQIAQMIEQEAHDAEVAAAAEKDGAMEDDDDDAISEWVCPNCDGASPIDVYVCPRCETPIPEAVLKLKELQESGARPGAEDDDTPIDPGMAEIIAALKKKKELARKRNANKAPAADEKPKKPISEMTTEEKMEWLENRRAEARKKRERDNIQAVKDREKNRRELGKAAAAAQEMVEEAKRKAFIMLKKKEQQDKVIQRRRLAEKLKEDKERRKREAEERAREAERIKAAKAAGKYP